MGVAAAAIAALAAGCGGRIGTSGDSGGGAGGGNGGSGGAGLGGGSGTGGGTQAPCDLSLIASGALPQRGQRTVQSVSVAASSKSYTIAYVEQDPKDSTSRNATLVDLTDSGQLDSGARNDLPGCVGPQMSLGSSVTFDTNGSVGLAAFAVSGCSGSGAGAMFIHLTAGAGPASPKLATSPEFTALFLDPHALAPLDADRFAFAYVPFPPNSPTIGGAELATLTGDAFDGGVVELFNAQPADTVAVSTSSSVRAFLSRLISGREVLQIGAPNTDAGAGSTHQLGMKTWGALTTIGNRVAVLLPTAAGLEYRLFDSNQQVQQGALEGPACAMADIAPLGNRLIVVGAHDKSLDFYRIDSIKGKLATSVQELAELSGALGTVPLPPIKSLAIAAARSTVAVVTTGSGTRGHWALLSCKN